jgi:hypothetical protein
MNESLQTFIGVFVGAGIVWLSTWLYSRRG